METKQKTHKDVINTEGIPEEMLYALYARAMESKRSDHHIYDKKAIEVVERTDFDFSDQSKGAAMGNGVLARTILLDKMVADYVRQHPQGVVVNIACGMDTRFTGWTMAKSDGMTWIYLSRWMPGNVCWARRKG